MFIHPIANPSHKCAVEDCPAGVVRDECCALHAAENDAAVLAAIVTEQLEHRSGTIEGATRAAQALLERLDALAACREAIARAAAPCTESGR